MKPNDLDRVLSEQIEIVPSRDFASGVMNVVRREASAPPPIPFPWKRALPGLAAGAVALVAMILVLVKNTGRPTLAAPIQASIFPALEHVVDFAKMYGIGWILVAMLVTLACAAVSMRLTTGSWRTL
jgi:hypothetical protein